MGDVLSAGVSAAGSGSLISAICQARAKQGLIEAKLG